MALPANSVDTVSHSAPRPGEIQIRPVYALAVVLLLLLAYGGYRSYLSRSITSAVEAIREEGYPATPSELDAWYPTPEDENAADLVLTAAANVVDDSSDLAWYPVFTGANWTVSAWDSGHIGALEQYLSKNRQALETLYRASEIEDARYSMSFAGVPNGAELIYLREVLKGANLLAMDSVVHACRGRAADAVKALAASIRIAQTLRAEPSMVSQQIRLAALQQTLMGIEWILPRIDLSQDERGDLLRELDALEDSTPITRAYVAARCLGLWFYGLPFDRQLAILGARGSHPNVNHFIYRYSGQLELDLLCFYEFMDRFVSLSSLPGPDRIALFEKTVTESLRVPQYHVGSSAYFRTTPHIVREFTDLTARVRAARTLLALDAYHADHQRLPTSLAVLVPEYVEVVARDPFNGEPLRYTTSEEMTRVYSVGINGLNEGGAIAREEGQGLALAGIWRGPRITYEIATDPGMRLVPELTTGVTPR